MPTSYEKLSALLKELFQLDQADLDFGIYRIMNQKRDEISHCQAADAHPGVSIHAPRVGSDSLNLLILSLMQAFQPTPPVWGGIQNALAL
jgi:hypothetical protein